MQREFRIISYDISSNRRRRRLSRLLSEYAERVQYSVFEGWLTDQQVQTFRRRAGRHVSGRTDSLRIYTLCGRCVETIDLLGEAETLDNEEFILV